ncbi:MAG TPA: argininosuccinate lyase [Candidatus Methylomirabilis sp.]|nr:argininosuccinate lyase [Candidatus Methylomirabilis sp.]
MESKVSRRLKEPAAREVCDNIYAPRLTRDFGAVFAYMTDLNQAHVLMLHTCGLISREVARQLAGGLLTMEQAGPGAVTLDPQREDAYFNYEAHLIGLVGTNAGGRLHIARSRNDLGAALDRMRARDALLDLVDGVLQVRGQALAQAERHAGVVMPGYTHLQPAQPVTFGWYLLGIAQALERDGQRLDQAYPRLNRNPLGAGALAGTTFPIDRQETARLLGFSGLVDHGLDAVASRDFVLEILSALSLLGITWSRLAQDFYVMTSYEFQSVEFPDSVTGTSSMMPQKKNPVVLEHLKGQTGHILGAFLAAGTAFRATSFTNTIDGNRDGVRALWEAAQEAQRCLRLADLIVRTATPVPAIMLKRAQENFGTATDLADLLVRDADLAFREAHHVVGAVVRTAMDRGLAAHQITSAMVDAAALQVVGRALKLPEAAVSRSLDPVSSVEGRTLRGGPARGAVLELVAEGRQRLAAERRAAEARRTSLADARATLKRELAALAGP